eukprot:TRINITY_DN5668_c1_g1_i1.p1 TRINITY_DN5668_c1_g1~~TRINITY_DN5668_c1_g1_i1.p1  ORF type:complete len:512 (-),score=116.52 TRINITY_DN5668_c1_g1_i1:342-1877(-)
MACGRPSYPRSRSSCRAQRPCRQRPTSSCAWRATCASARATACPRRPPRSASATHARLPRQRGGLLPVAQVKLRDVPSMGYTSKDKPPRGEIMVRGPTVFKGYHKNQAETDEVLVDGWLCTGDIGKWNADGSLAIIDRRKNILSLATGEHVAVENVTSELVKSPFVTQMWVHVAPGQSALVAVVVPNKLYIELQWAPKYGQPPDLEVLVASPDGELKQAVLNDLQRQAKSSRLASFERVRNICFETRMDASGLGFTVENDLMTPTHKLRRSALTDRYAEEVLTMYGDMGRVTRLGGAEKALKSGLSPESGGEPEVRAKRSRRSGGGGGGGSSGGGGGGGVLSPGDSSCSSADPRGQDLSDTHDDDGESVDLDDEDDLFGDDDEDSLDESDSGDSDEDAASKRGGSLSARKSRPLLPMKKKKAEKSSRCPAWPHLSPSLSASLTGRRSWAWRRSGSLPSARPRASTPRRSRASRLPTRRRPTNEAGGRVGRDRDGLAGGVGVPAAWRRALMP